jgi:hypothetical protein
MGLKESGYEVGPWAVSYAKPGRQCKLRVEVRWRDYPNLGRPPAFLQRFVDHPGALSSSGIPKAGSNVVLIHAAVRLLFHCGPLA